MADLMKCFGCKKKFAAGEMTTMRTDFKDVFGNGDVIGPYHLCPACTSAYLALVRKIDNARKDVYRQLAEYLMSDKEDGSSTFQQFFIVEEVQDKVIELQTLTAGTKH